MSKPWDKLRVKPQSKPDPIGAGEWMTNSKNGTKGRASVRVAGIGKTVDILVHQAFDASGLGELIEFLSELKAQLESK